MVVPHSVEGYDGFLKFIKNLETSEPIYVLYTGTKLANGNSWCPDCVEAEPFIEEGLKAAPENAHFVVVEVGDRAFWKDPSCLFRTNLTTKLKVLPTLARWGTQKRLEGFECTKLDLIEMLLTDEDD